MIELTKAGRLALRVEGSMWNAYWALPNTMEGAIFLGSIPLNAAKRSPVVKEGFHLLMREVVSALLPGATWPNDPQPAPLHERGGNA